MKRILTHEIAHGAVEHTGKKVPSTQENGNAFETKAYSGEKNINIFRVE